MKSIHIPLNLGKVLKFLDKPYMWMVYFIIGLYVSFLSLFILRGIVQYNRVLDMADKSTTLEINKELSDKGFTIMWGNTPTIRDYFTAGFKN